MGRGGTVIYLLRALVIRPLTTHHFRDGARGGDGYKNTTQKYIGKGVLIQGEGRGGSDGYKTQHEHILVKTCFLGQVFQH